MPKEVEMLTQRDLSGKQHADAGHNPMSPTKIKAFMEKFPWVKKHVAKPIVQVYVSDIESSFLNYFPQWIDIDNLLVGSLFGLSYFCERILLLNEKFEVVIAEIEREKKRFIFFGPIVLKKKN